MIASVQQRATVLDERIRGGVLGGARIIVGLMWLANLHWKVPPGFGESSGGGLYKYSASVLRHSTFAPFTWVTEHIVLPNFSLFGWFTVIAETTIAVLLLIGYRTKLAALAGAAFTIPIFLSVIYYDRSDEWAWAYFLMFAAHLLIYASDAGAHIGLDGVLRRGGDAPSRAIRNCGIIATLVGVLGLYVARSIDFAGSKVALLGSDAGFVNDQGDLVRRWELKFMWFNPLWALLTIVLGVLAIIAFRVPWAARISGAGFAILAVVIFVMQSFDYVRDDGALQSVGTAANAAVWMSFAVVILLSDRAARRPANGAAATEPAVA
jgi:thiosulfate dehydrogenase (quinone) large subunit